MPRVSKQAREPQALSDIAMRGVRAGQVEGQRRWVRNRLTTCG